MRIYAAAGVGGAFHVLLRDTTCSGSNMQSRNYLLVDFEIVQNL